MLYVKKDQSLKQFAETKIQLIRQLSKRGLDLDAIWFILSEVERDLRESDKMRIQINKPVSEPPQRTFFRGFDQDRHGNVFVEILVKRSFRCDEWTIVVTPMTWELWEQLGPDEFGHEAVKTFVRGVADFSVQRSGAPTLSAIRKRSYDLLNAMA